MHQGKWFHDMWLASDKCPVIRVVAGAQVNLGVALQCCRGSATCCFLLQQDGEATGADLPRQHIIKCGCQQQWLWKYGWHNSFFISFLVAMKTFCSTAGADEPGITSGRQHKLRQV